MQGGGARNGWNPPKSEKPQDLRPAAFVMAAFTLAAGVFFHRNFADQNQMIHFLKNVMMAGGLLQIAAFGAGAISIERWRRKSGAPCAAAAINA